MRTAKKYDCVQMKDQIQGQLQRHWQGLTEEQIRAEVQKHLATSDAEVAKWWRSAETAKQEP